MATCAGSICVNTDMKGENEIASLSKQPNRTSSSFCVPGVQSEWNVTWPSIFLHCFASPESLRRDSMSACSWSAALCWVYAERAESRGEWNDDPEDLVQCCNTHVPPGTLAPKDLTVSLCARTVLIFFKAIFLSLSFSPVLLTYILY